MPVAMSRVPRRIPGSWVAGYWGRMFTNGQQHLIDWKPQDLKQQDRVGFLVSPKGESVVYVNGQEKVRFKETLVPTEEPLLPIVDVFASTASVTI